jgi:prephenate dehydrogenase
MFTGLQDIRVGIIGLGLMGGSLALALRNHCATIAGYDNDPAVIERAIKSNVIDHALDITHEVDQIDLLILATPVGAILDWLVQIPIVFRGSLHLLDLGSTKAQIVNAMQQLPDRISPLGGHPMCGKETSGLSAADPALFKNRLFVLTPLERTQPNTLSLAHELIEAIGSRPLIIDPNRHDRLTAAISHVPYLTSIALIEAAMHSNDELVWQLAASGFRDSTRLAASDLTMMIDILFSNKEAVLNNVVETQRSLQELTDLIKREDRAGLRTRLEQNRTRRKNLSG